MLFACGWAVNLLESLRHLQPVSRAHGVVVSHPLSMREALGSIPSVSISVPQTCTTSCRPNAFPLLWGHQTCSCGLVTFGHLRAIAPRQGAEPPDFGQQSAPMQRHLFERDSLCMERLQTGWWRCSAPSSSAFVLVEAQVCVGAQSCNRPRAGAHTRSRVRLALCGRACEHTCACARMRLHV